LIRGVLFDYGGTLVEMERPWSDVKEEAIRSEYDALKARGLGLSFDDYHLLNDATFRRFAEREAAELKDIPDLVKYEDIVSQIFPTMPAAWRDGVAALATRTFWSTVTRSLALRGDAKPCLEELKSKGLLMAVVSNHHNGESLTEHLSGLQVSGYFSHILASSQLEFRKPDPRIIEKSLSLLGLGRDQAVFVGDSLEFDVGAARRAGVKSILLTSPSGDGASPAGQKPDFTIESLVEVPRIVTSL